MSLSESAERGKKLALLESVFCVLASIMSLLTLNIPSALVGFWAAEGIKKGSLAARTICIILRIADIPLLIIIGILIYRGELPAGGFIAVIAFEAFIDTDMLLTLGFDKNVGAYFREVNFNTE